MKILFHHRIRSKDGQAVHMDELVHAFRDAGHEVLVVGPKSFARASFGHDPKFLNSLKARIPRFAYECLEIAYNVVAFARLQRACSRLRPDFLYERHNLYTLAGVWVSRLNHVPRLLEINAPLAHERGANDGLAFPTLARALENWSWRTATWALPVTDALARYLERGGVQKKRICVIPNAINPGVFDDAPAPEDARAALGLEEKLVVGFTGFVRDWHGMDQIIDWLSERAPENVHLLIAGEGPALASLKSQAQRLSLSHRVTFSGLVERSEIARYIAAFDIAIVPKCVDYCSPLKLFEYMALAKAIVAPDQANIREVLTDRQSAVLFQPAERQSLFDALDTLATSADLRRRLGANAKDVIAAKRMHWIDNASRIVGLASEAINGSASVKTSRLVPGKAVD